MIGGLLSIVGHTAALAVALRTLEQSRDVLLHLTIVTTVLYDIFLTGQPFFSFS